MTYRVRIDFDEGDTMWVAAVTEPAYLTEDHTKARRVHNRSNARQYTREWEATLELLGLSGRVIMEDYRTSYPVPPRLSPEGTRFLCDTCGREWLLGQSSGCEPCANA